MLFRSQLVKTDSLVQTQAVLFAILFAIWGLPETILIRNLCLVLGGLIGIYQIYTYRACLANKKAIPIFLISALFVWATFHLLFLSNNFALQLIEYRSIWKRSLIGAIFAFGFGLGIVNSSFKTRQSAWTTFYIGLLLPTLIYMLKFSLLYYEKQSGINVGAYWHIYIAKTTYMGFCIPALAIALGQIYSQITQGKWLTLANLIYLGTIPSVLFVFYAENIKNGVLYSFIFIAIFIGIMTYRYFKTDPLKISIYLGVIILCSSIFIKYHIQQNHSWITFLADAKIAYQLDNYQNWKCGTSLGYPRNELGETVSITNYERISWGISAVKLGIKHPLGFGLIERSFGQWGSALWPEACLSQSHSGWLDLILGIGVPGIFLLLGSLLMCLKGLLSLKLATVDHLSEWRSMAISVLIGFTFIWCTTEISQKVFFDELIFFIALSGGFILPQKTCKSNKVF